MSMRKFTTKYTFKPIDIRSPFFADDMLEIVPNRVKGYRTLKTVD
jgi:hypothetical protein